MPTPAGYGEWGYLGAVVFLVIAFGAYLLRRDKEAKERDEAWRSFFTSIRSSDSETSRKMAEALEKVVCRLESLEAEFKRHDATEMEFLRGAQAQQQKTQPRKPTRSNE